MNILFVSEMLICDGPNAKCESIVAIFFVYDCVYTCEVHHLDVSLYNGFIC